MPPRSSPRRLLVLFVPAALVAMGLGIWIGASRAGREGREGSVVSAGTAGAAAEVRGVFATVCATCHGAAGEGNREMMAPSIASLPRWYVEEQLRKFRLGHRGGEAADVDGQRMRAALLAMTEDAEAEAVETLVAFPPVRPARSLGEGDIENGAVLYETYCMGCHRYNGHGELAFRSSPLAGLQDWYLAAQMEKFRSGIRGTHPGDADGLKMRDAARLPVDGTEVRDILAFVAGLADRYPVTKDGGWRNRSAFPGTGGQRQAWPGRRKGAR